MAQEFPSPKLPRFNVSASASDVDGPSQRVGSRRRGRPRKIRSPEEEASRGNSSASEHSRQGDEASWTESSSDEASGSDGEGFRVSE
ncbi:hypothetical protein CLOM_g10591 [Closterium sp. NIES-68]|nr:hypothetical protein CLOM_g10591 [Closterium sp. NIES-68]